MEDYLNIMAILGLVYAGKNLKEEFLLIKSENNIAKIKNICYGILRNYFSINFKIRKLTNHIDEKMKLLLQIAIFEIDHSKKPIYAVINDSVNLSFDITNRESTKKFINGVLREYTRQKDSLEELINKDYSLKYNLPNWFIDKLKLQKKNNYLEILNGFDFHPAFGIRINNKKITQLNYLSKLESDSIEYKVINNKVALIKPININGLPLFIDGLVSIQDLAAQYLVDILDNNCITPNKVLDICSAPGGKTCQLLENYSSINMFAGDISELRLAQVKQNLVRLGLDANLFVGDANNDKWWNGIQFDLIVADVPCSATGTIKRNPDIKVNRKLEDIQKFVLTQQRIISNIWKMLEVDGYLVYITCSIFNEENNDNINWFENNLTGFKLIEELQIFPTQFNDSLYYALIKKVGE